MNEHLSWAGGVETYLLSAIPELEQRGHEQVLVYAQGESGSLGRTHHVPELSRGDRKADDLARRRLRTIIDEEQPDLLHLHQVYSIGAIEACLERLPVVVHAHDYRYVCPASTFFYKRTGRVCHRTAGPGCFTVTALKHCMTPRPTYAFDYYRRVRWFAGQKQRISAIIAPSEAARQRYLAAGFAPNRVQVLPYFCTLAPTEQPRPAPAVPTVLFIGRIRDNKGPDIFVEAFACLPTGTRGVMIGDFSGPARDAVEHHAERFGCRDRLTLKSWVGRNEVRAEFEQASVFVFPSIWPETLGIVGIEALACGVPAVASDIGGVREWLENGRTGFLAEPKNAQDFAAKITRLLEDGALNEQFGRDGQRLIRERFTPEVHIEALLDIYRASIDEWRTPREVAAN